MNSIPTKLSFAKESLIKEKLKLDQVKSFSDVQNVFLSVYNEFDALTFLVNSIFDNINEVFDKEIDRICKINPNKEGKYPVLYLAEYEHRLRVLRGY